MTVGAEEPEQILSQDTRGRVLVTPERRELLLAEYDRSGMSGMKFAQYVGIKYSTLAYWLQRRREQRRKEKSLVKAGADPKPGRSNGGWIASVLPTTRLTVARICRGYFLLAGHAAGVSSGIRCIGISANPGRTEPR